MGGPALDPYVLEGAAIETLVGGVATRALQGVAHAYVYGSSDLSFASDSVGLSHTLASVRMPEAPLTTKQHARMTSGATPLGAAEGEGALAANGSLPVSRVGSNGAVKNVAVERTVMANIPTGEGDFKLAIYSNNSDGKEHMAMVYGRPEQYSDVPVRIHCECFTGDVMGSLRCDCGEQLRSAMTKIAEAGVGVIVYLRQEGRGIGLVEKLRAYNLQDRGFDTVEANLALGHQADARDYTVGALILRDLGVRSVRILTNNPDKIDCLRAHGISVTERIAMRPSRLSEYNLAYLTAKVKRMRHLLNLSDIGAPGTVSPMSSLGASASSDMLPRSPLRSPAIALLSTASGASSGSATPDIATPANSRAGVLSRNGSEDGDVEFAYAAHAAQTNGSVSQVSHHVDVPHPSVELPGMGLAERPYVTLTYAQSLDGCIATADRRPLMLSGPKSMTLTHGLRATHTAIMVGIGTILTDDPRLTVRLVQGTNPQPVVLDTHLRFPLTAKLLSGPTRPWIFCGPNAAVERRVVLEAAGATVVPVPLNDDGSMLSIEAVLRELVSRGTASLMVEGGASVIQSFLTSRFVDRLIVTIAPVVVGGVSAVGRDVRVSLPSLARPRYEQFGTDMVLFAEPTWGPRS